MTRIVLDPDDVNQERVITTTDGELVDLGQADKRTLDRVATQLFIHRSSYAHAFRSDDDTLTDRVHRGQVAVSEVSPLYLRIASLQTRARPTGGRGAGQLDLEVLLQTTTWTSSSGRTRPLVDLTPSHRQNLLGWMERASDDLERRFGEDPELTDQQRALVADGDPWVAGTPVYRRLAQLIATQSAREEAMDEARQVVRHVEFERSGQWPDA